ncbi:MAG: J domain-containing protein [Planctomycetaceae bacterium]
MNHHEFSDFYEVLEVSPNANCETIERIFRYHGQRLHPDNAETGNDERFRLLLKAYSTLRDPDKRAAYDVAYREHQKDKGQLADGAAATSSDSAQRHTMLSLFYSQRRRDMRQPGIGISTLEQVMKCPREVLEFHLWYFKEKAWVKREESGLYAITAEGIDRIESSQQNITAKDRLITMRKEPEVIGQRNPVAQIS